MNVETYNLDSLRKLVRNLQDENRRLRELLDKADITFDPKNVFEEKIVSSRKLKFQSPAQKRQIKISSPK